MSLYAIGDLHLSLGGSKPMDVFGGNWEGHVTKLKSSFEALEADDLTVLCGDISWAMNIQEALPDFDFLSKLPGKKIILKGNHDYWWLTAKKIKEFFSEHSISGIYILHNNFFEYGDYAICGTRGWLCDAEYNSPHDEKIIMREAGRLECSLKLAGDREKIVFLHYPPVFMDYECKELTSLLRNHSVRLCCYGHIHGQACKNAFIGWRNGTEYKLVSADYLNFSPIKIV